MDIKGKVYCFFEQSGIFKNEFIKLGIPAQDYDLQDNFGETDYIIDLFVSIEQAYMGEVSLFDDISQDDLIIAFFPCIYFESTQQLSFCLSKYERQGDSKTVQIKYAIERLQQRTKFHELLYKFLYIAYDKGLRVIIENPATAPNYLITGQNFPRPSWIDKNRMLRGDYFKKPTAYWFVNCEPTNGCTIYKDKVQKYIDKCRSSKVPGLCSEDRSIISSDYARNFICDKIIGRYQENSQLSLFGI